MSAKRATWLDVIKLVVLVAVLVAIFGPSTCGMYTHTHPPSLEDHH